MRPEDVLGVPPGAPADVVRAAYRRALRHHHPDRHGQAPPEVQVLHARRLQAATEAWRALGAPGVAPAGPSPRPGSPRSEAGSWAPPSGTGPLDPADLDPAPYRAGAPRRSGLAVLPAGLFALAAVVFVVAVMFSSPALWLAAGVCLLASLVLFALAPFLVMVRGR